MILKVIGKQRGVQFRYMDQGNSGTVRQNQASLQGIDFFQNAGTVR